MRPGRLRYLRSEQANAGDVSLGRVRVTAGDKGELVGELDGLLIDLVDRRAKYLVVQAARTHRRYVVPLDGTAVHCGERVLACFDSDPLESWEPFDASHYARYDDEAMMSLLFGRTAA